MSRLCDYYHYVSGDIPDLGGNVIVMSVTGPHLQHNKHRFQEHELPVMIAGLEKNLKTVMIGGKSESIRNCKLDHEKFEFSGVGMEVTISFWRDGHKDTVKRVIQFVPPAYKGDLHLVGSWQRTLTKRPDLHKYVIHLADTKILIC